MIQDALVDYISSQMKSGVSRDAIKATLVGAGWVALDVEDTLKKVEGPAAAVSQPVQPAKPIGVSAASASPFFSSAGVSAGTGSKSPERSFEPQTIKVSDLVSASSPAPSSAFPGSLKDSAMAKGGANSPRTGVVGPAKTEKSGHGFVATLVFSIIIVVLAALSGYLFWQNSTLMSQVGSVNVASQGVTGQVASFQSQVQALDASNTALAAQVATLTTTNQALLTNLSFMVVPPGSAATSTPITLSGLVSGGKPTYVVTTGYGVKVSIKNSSVLGVQAALQPLVGSTSTAQIAGTYIPGVASVTVTAVNGASVTASPTAATTTASVASTSASSTATP